MRSGGVQIINANYNHWVCLSTLSTPPNSVDVYDSLNTRVSPHISKQASLILQSTENSVTLRSMRTPRQKGASDCGLFAIAIATDLCFGVQPGLTDYNQSAMRKHLAACFIKGKMEPFPKMEEKSTNEGTSAVLSTTVVNIYCSCRLPEDRKQRMARCTNCGEWYHQACEVIPESVFRRKTRFVCKVCHG